MALRGPRWDQAARDSLAQARAASWSSPLDERLEASAAWMVLSIRELARRARDRDELEWLLRDEVPRGETPAERLRRTGAAGGSR